MILTLLSTWIIISNSQKQSSQTILYTRAEMAEIDQKDKKRNRLLHLANMGLVVAIVLQIIALIQT